MEVESVPSLSIELIHDDNIYLSAPGSEQSEKVMRLMPGIVVEAKSKNTEIDIEYYLENIIYDRGTIRDQLNHQFDINSNSIFLNNKLFLDTAFQYGQTNISPADVLGQDNVAVTDNRTNVFGYSVSPYMVRSIGPYAELRAYYTYSGYDYGNNASLVDYTNDSVRLNLNNNNTYTQLQWDINYSNNKTKYENISNVEFIDYNFGIKYLITSKSYVTALAGSEDNIYTYNAQDAAPQGSYWNAGLGWRPSPRTHLAIIHGERFFGKTNEFSFTHAGKQTRYNLNYSERLQTQSFREDEEGGLTGDNVIGYNPTVNISTVFTTEVYLGKRWILETSWETRKSLLTLAGFSERRIYQLGKDTDKTLGIDAAYNWQFVSNNFINLRHSQLRQYIRSSTRVDDLYLTTLEYERQVHPKLSGRIYYRITDRRSTDSSLNYDRNMIGIIVDAQF